MPCKTSQHKPFKALKSFVIQIQFCYNQEKELLEVFARPKYELKLTNLEVEIMFSNMLQDWFQEVQEEYNAFITSLLLNDIDAINDYMNHVALCTFSYFDTCIILSTKKLF